MDPPIKSSEPPETDLDYYARPENYTGSNLNTLTKFLIAKDKEESKKKKKVSKRKKARSDERELFRRYRHILPAEVWDASSSSSSSDDEEDNEESNSKEEKSTKHVRSQRHRRRSRQNEDKEAQKEDVNTVSPDYDDDKKTEKSSHETEVSDTEPESGYASRMRSGTDQLNEDKIEELSPPFDRILTTESADEDDETKADEGQEGIALKDSDSQHTTSTASTNDTESVNLTDNDSITSDFLSRTSMTNVDRLGSASAKKVPLQLAKFFQVKSKLTHLSRDARRRVYLQKFQKLIIGVVNVLKLAKAIIKPADSPSALLKTFTAMSKEPETDDTSENMKSYGLHFDPSYYKANREFSISSEVKSILRLPPNRRTPEMIQTAMFGLQSLPSFAEYPLHMQEKLTKVAWYEIVTPKRTIIRQGHFAENFYFILSGQALVTIHKPGEARAQTAAMMRKGTSFGELALLHHSRRTATVTSHDTVQLLSVGREDFFDIFMSGHGTDQMPEHIKFISQLDFMKDWPLERLLERPDQCLLHFFKRNMVIMKDSKASEWFYVVKSGSCQVLKQLKGVTGRLGTIRHPSNSTHDTLGSLQTGAALQESRIDNGRRLRRRKPPKAVFNIEKFLLEQEQEEKERERRRNESSDETSTSDKDSSAESDRTRPSFSKLRYSSKLRTGTPHFGRSILSSDSSGRHEREQSPKSPQHRHKSRQMQEQQVQQQPQPQRHHEQQPVFVQIELLKPKDVFGLDLVNFNNSFDTQSSSVSLVSLGAECIMLSKAFFMKYANDRVKKRFSEIAQPYPDEGTLQDSLQNKVDWELYKRSLITSVQKPKSTGLRGQPLTISR